MRYITRQDGRNRSEDNTTQYNTMQQYSSTAQYISLDSREKEVALAVVGEQNVAVLPEEVTRLLHRALHAGRNITPHPSHPGDNNDNQQQQQQQQH